MYEDVEVIIAPVSQYIRYSQQIYMLKLNEYISFSLANILALVSEYCPDVEAIMEALHCTCEPIY